MINFNKKQIKDTENILNYIYKKIGSEKILEAFRADERPPCIIEKNPIPSTPKNSGKIKIYYDKSFDNFSVEIPDVVKKSYHILFTASDLIMLYKYSLTLLHLVYSELK